MIVSKTYNNIHKTCTGSVRYKPDTDGERRRPSPLALTLSPVGGEVGHFTIGCRRAKVNSNSIPTRSTRFEQYSKWFMITPITYKRQ